jgi:hypothetical protein
MEPNGPTDSLEQIVIRNCTALNQYGGGFTVSYSGLSELSKPVDVKFEQCRVDGAGCGTGFSAQTWRKSKGPKGKYTGLVDQFPTLKMKAYGSVSPQQTVC